VHTFFIAVVLVLMGLLSAFFAKELMQPDPLSHALCFGLMIFWLLRLGVQWFIYDSRIWRCSRFLTTMHWMFSLLWMYLAGTYSSAWQN